MKPRRHNPSKGASCNRISYLRSRACSPEGRSYAKVCLTYLQWLLVVSGAEAIQALIDQSQKFVCGRVRLKLYKGNVIVVGRESDNSLFDEEIATFEDDAGLMINEMPRVL